MAEKTMHHAVIGPDTFELIDKAGREETSQLKNALIVNNASGAIASFPDGGDGFPVRDLKVDIEPVQDLHGYDSPWPGGGNRNLLDLGGQYTIAQAGNAIPTTALTKPIPAGTYIVALTSSGAVAWAVIFTDSNGNSVGSFASNTDNAGRQSKTGALTDTAYNVRIYVNGGTTISEIQFESGSTATDYVPYSNICPISGRDSVSVTRTGKNLFDKSTAVVGKWVNVNTGVEEDTSNGYALSDYIPVKAGKTYVMTDPSSSRKWLYDTNKNPLVKIDRTVFTPTQNGFARLTIALNTVPVDAIQVELGSVVTAYEPYQGQSIEIQLGQTVYGGTLDVTQGELVIDRAIVDLGTLTWSTPISANPNCFTARDLVSLIKGRDDAICDTYEVLYGTTTASAINSAADKTLMINKGNNGTTGNYPIGTIIVKDSDYASMTAAEFKTAMSGVQLCYELATPQTYQITPQQMTTLLGQNNVWSDADSVSVDYVADTKLYIEQLTEPDGDMIADMNITSGSYFMVGNNLYLATANIANGAAIVVGVNCTRTSLAEALNAINA